MSKARTLSSTVSDSNVLADGVVSLSELTGATANGVVYANGSGVTTNGSALTFDGTNLLGVGTNAVPAHNVKGIVVANTANAAALQLTNNVGGGSVGGSLLYAASGDDFQLYTFTGAIGSETYSLRYNITSGGATHQWNVGASEAMRLTTTGLGIGTSSPAYKLDVNKGSSGVVQRWDTGSVSMLVEADHLGSGNWFLSPQGSSTFNVKTGGSTRLTLDSSGNLGVGVTPSAWGAYKPYQVGWGALASTAATQNTLLSSNVYFDGSNFRYIGSSTASYLQQFEGAFIWKTAPSGTAGNAISFTQAMTLDASGNLGIGTTSPQRLLHVNGSVGSFRLQGTSVGGYIEIVGPTTTNFIGTPAAISSGSTTDLGFYLNGSEAMRLDSSGNLGIGTSSPTAKLESAGNIGFGTGGTFAAGQIYSDANWGVIFRAKQASPALAEFGFFNAGGTERARIDASGNLLVGTTSNIGVSVLSVYSPNLATTANGIGIKNGTDNTGGYFLSFKKSDNTTIGSIVQGVNSVSYVTSSDYRLKEDWVAVADASTRINALKPVNFAWKADGKRVDGFLAHELAEVVPEAVTGEKDAVDADGNPVYQGIDQSKLVPLLTAALQEALAEINTLKARLDAAGL